MGICYTRTSRVPGILSWKPRLSESQTIAGMTMHRSSVRAAGRHSPTQSPFNATTRHPQIRCPGEPPIVGIKIICSTANTARVTKDEVDVGQNRWVISSALAQSISSARMRLPKPAMLWLPSRGKPSRSPGHSLGGSRGVSFLGKRVVYSLVSGVLRGCAPG